MLHLFYYLFNVTSMDPIRLKEFQNIVMVYVSTLAFAFMQFIHSSGKRFLTDFRTWSGKPGYSSISHINDLAPDGLSNVLVCLTYPRRTGEIPDAREKRSLNIYTDPFPITVRSIRPLTVDHVSLQKRIRARISRL